MQQFKEVMPKFKQCVGPYCGGQIKPVYDFYPRSDGEPQSWCKFCYLEHSKRQKKYGRNETGIDSYDAVIAEALKHKIPAGPKKRARERKASLVFWDCVYAKVAGRRFDEERNHYQFGLGKRQTSVDLVILVIIEDGERIFHLFEASDPVFYRDGNPKTSVTWSPFADHHKQPDPMTNEKMREARNRWTLVEKKRQEWIDAA